MTGLIHIYFGNGKGKTTASIGLIIRQLSINKKVLLVQFLKNPQEKFSQYGEINFFSKQKNIVIKQFGTKDWVVDSKNENANLEVKKAFDFLIEKLISKEFDLVVADEILYAFEMNLLLEEDIKKLILAKPKTTELVLTGSHKFFDCFNLADYVTEIKKHKHPYDKGIVARKGIEY
ncbi:MAG: cob(I)yrinic acid a,c-diamide adenosyltransferase [archaeon]|jgi:cob(I)alamin adenosyltransferase